MPDAINPKFRTVFIVTSWIPLTMHLAMFQYVKQFDGWGAWAAAPLLLPAIGLSIVMGLIGIVLYVRQLKAGHPDHVVLAATCLSASVIVYFLIRGFLF